MGTLSDREKEAYDAFKDFHPQYIESDGIQAEMSNIICSIMDRAYPPILPEAIQQALSDEILTKSFPGE